MELGREFCATQLILRAPDCCALHADDARNVGKFQWRGRGDRSVSRVARVHPVQIRAGDLPERDAEEQRACVQALGCGVFGGEVQGGVEKQAGREFLDVDERPHDPIGAISCGGPQVTAGSDTGGKVCVELHAAHYTGFIWKSRAHWVG